MGLGNWGTILIVIAVLWGVWTFFLSPDAGNNRGIGGGILGVFTGDQKAVEDAIKTAGSDPRLQEYIADKKAGTIKKASYGYSY